MIKWAAFSVLMIATNPVYGYEFYEERGGWNVVAADEACGMTMEYEGPGETSVMFLKDLDNNIFLGVTNYNWSAEKDKSYEVGFVLNGVNYSGAGGSGFVSGIRKGFSAKFEPSFEKDFRAGRSLHVYLAGARIDRLSLTGTSVAMDAVNRCLVGLKAEKRAEARDEARWADLPDDPFAQTAALSLPRGPKPKGSPGYWVSSDDYPSKALREERSGTSIFRVKVGTDGRVQTCEVTSSSGHGDLDAAACTAVMRRARFETAIGDEGQPIEGWYSNSMRWIIPEPPAPLPVPITCEAGKICTRN